MVISFYSSQDSHLILTQISMWMYPFASILRQHVKQIHALLMITLPCTLVSQFTSVTLSCPTFCDPMDCNTLGFPVLINSWSLLNLMSIQLVMPSNHLILCCPLLLPLSIFPSIRVFSNESVLCIRWPKYRSFSFTISPSNEYSGLISFRIDWFDPLAVQEILKNLLQNHNLKASVLWHSAFFMVQLSHLHMTTGKTMTLTIKTFSKLLYPSPAYFPICPWVWC